MRKINSFAADIREQFQKQAWRRRVISLADAGLPWVPVIGQNRYLRNSLTFPSELHAHYGCVEVVYCKKGFCRYEMEGGTFLVKAGMALVTQPGQQHRRTDPRLGSEINYLLVRLPKAEGRLKGLTDAETRCLVTRLTSCPQVTRCGRGIASLFQRVLALAVGEKSPERDIRIKCGVLELILSLNDGSRPKMVRCALANQVRRIAYDMSRAPGHAWSVDELMARLGVSLPNAIRRFKEETGFTPHAFLVRCRIAQAKRLLENGSLSLSGIAMQLGFSSVQHFIGVFRNRVGVSPGVWRRRGHDALAGKGGGAMRK